MASLITQAERDLFVRRVRVAMARSGMTREALAERAACKERTLGNLLSGQPVRDQTLAKVARVLGIDIEDVFSRPLERSAPAERRAGEDYGGYLLSAYEAYPGTYLAYRRVLSDRAELFRSVYEIDWDDELNRLRFFELQRFRGVGDTEVASSHAGGIYISPHTGLLHFLTTFQGALRLMTLNKFRSGDQKLIGVILTQRDREVFFQPAVSPIYLEKTTTKRKNSELDKLVGALKAGDPGFDTAAGELDRIEREVVMFAGRRSDRERMPL